MVGDGRIKLKENQRDDERELCVARSFGRIFRNARSYREQEMRFYCGEQKMHPFSLQY